MTVILVITGMPYSGKTEAANVAAERGIKVINMGDVVREEARKRGLEETRETLEKLMRELRKTMGMGAVAKLCCERISEEDKLVVIDGARNLEEIGEFNKKGITALGHSRLAEDKVLAGVEKREKGRRENVARIRQEGHSGTGSGAWEPHSFGGCDDCERRNARRPPAKNELRAQRRGAISRKLAVYFFVGGYEFMVVQLPDEVRRLENCGKFSLAKKLVEKMLKDERVEGLLRLRLEWELERIRRVLFDFRLSKKEALEELRKYVPDADESDLERWTEEGYAEWRLVEGEIRYFRRFAPNLVRNCEEARKRAKKDEKREKARRLLLERIDQIIREGARERFVLPVKNRVRMKITVREGVVPEGEKVRCWIPLPRVDELQPEVRVLAAYPSEYVIAPEDAPQRTIYFEREATGEGLEFWVEYEYVVRASFARVDPKKVEECQDEKIYGTYTAEQLPHIAFTPYLRKLAERIVGNEKNPYLKAKRIYDWVTTHVRYALVPEYSTFECISDYVARNLRGDCGFFALLFITLCRISGVPARWQSGWYMNPVSPGPHDWAQFYVEPYGWLYADLSFGSRYKAVEKYHSFYFGNIDHFRLAANVDICSEFTPPKLHWRSDNVDNQRGEVEWRGGNLYYDTWDYELKLLEHRFLR